MLVEETEEEKEAKRIEALKQAAEDEGAHVIHADEKRLQMLRH